jgi:hypothetical protein
MPMILDTGVVVVIAIVFWICETFCVRSSYIPTIIFRLFSILLRYRISNDNGMEWNGMEWNGIWNHDERNEESRRMKKSNEKN